MNNLQFTPIKTPAVASGVLSEDRLQAKIWQRAWNEYPQIRRKMWAVPNGGSRNMIEAMKLKATGLLEGVWDLHMFYKNRFYIFELKVNGNDLTIDRIDTKGKRHYGQKEWGEIMRGEGAVTFVIRSEEEFFNILDTIV